MVTLGIYIQFMKNSKYITLFVYRQAKYINKILKKSYIYINTIFVYACYSQEIYTNGQTEYANRNLHLYILIMFVYLQTIKQNIHTATFITNYKIG